MNLVTTWKLTVVLQCYTSQMRAVVSGTVCSWSGEGLIFITQLTSFISITLAIFYCIWDLWGMMKIFSVFFQVHLQVLENVAQIFLAEKEFTILGKIFQFNMVIHSSFWVLQQPSHSLIGLSKWRKRKP